MYDKAIEFFNIALKLEGKDGTYAVWLGYANLFGGIASSKMCDGADRKDLP